MYLLFLSLIRRQMYSLIHTDLLEHETKNVQNDIFRKKGLNTLENFPKEKFAHAYTDGSSDKILTNGGSGMFLTTSDDAPHEGKFCAGNIASNFTASYKQFWRHLICIRSFPLLRRRRIYGFLRPEGRPPGNYKGALFYHP